MGTEIEWLGDGLGAAEILDLLGMRRRTGTIQVVVDDDAYGLYIEDGCFLFATSSHRTLRLGHLLLQRGAVEPAYLHDLLRGRRSMNRNQPLGGVLVRDGAVSLADLAAGIEEQCIEILARVLGLSGASFLYFGENPVPTGIEIVPLDTHHIFDEARKRHLQRASARVLQRLLPPADARLSLTVQLALVSFQLTDPELLVALSVERGNRTLHLLGAVVPLDPLTLKRTVISLMERAYLVRGDPPLQFHGH